MKYKSFGLEIRHFFLFEYKIIKEINFYFL